MDLHDSPEEADFRARLGEWLDHNEPWERQPHDSLEWHAAVVEWNKRMYDAGYIGVSFPVEYGGKGLGPVHEAIISQETGRRGVPAGLGTSYMARAILMFGSEDLRKRHIPDFLRGDKRWSQGFSEPGAGSDLAALSTKAVLTEEGYRITGQKVWTSFGHCSDMGLLLVRSEPDVPKHKGLSMLIVDMASPGIDVRPIAMFNGREEFCEVFYDDVLTPAENLIGRPGQGWEISMTMLTFERGPVDVGYIGKMEGMVHRLVAIARERGSSADPEVRRTLGQLHTDIEVLKLHCTRSLSRRAQGHLPGAEGSIDKLMLGRVEQRLTKAALAIVGSDPLQGDEDGWFAEYLFALSATIYGGSAQIQRDILSTRVLGLPRG